MKTTETKSLSTFIEKVKAGREGAYRGIPGGLERFDEKVYNTQFAKMYSIVGSPKSGKSAFMLWRYIFIPWVNGQRNIKWILYSLEMDVDQVKARLASMFIYYYYKKTINPNLIYSYGSISNRLSDEDFALIEKIEEEYLSKLFEKITFIEDKDASNPTGIYKYALSYARANGVEGKASYQTLDDTEKTVTKYRTVSYTPNDPDEKVFIIVDTLGLMKRERGFSKKENIDKWLDDYAITLRNIYKYTIVNLHHLNRGISSIERRKFQAEELQPELEDIKDTSALAESSDMVIAVFNPNTYAKIDIHQNYKITKFKGKYRSIHVIASRFTEFPINSGLLFAYENGMWLELPRPDNATALETLYKTL